jgi:phospholipid transport system substrate-binding protein
MMGVRSLGVALACLLLVIFPAGQTRAGVVSEQLKEAVDRVVKLLDDPAFKGSDRTVERRAGVTKIAQEIFDFPEVARRSLARHWQPLTDKQRDEFTALFSDLLERSYVSKIEVYSGEKITYASERIDGDTATVPTRIVTKSGAEVPIDYRMLKKGARWLVYDVNIEGVSLVSNYRTQFNKIIQTSSFNELIQKLKTKQGELTVGEQPKDTKPAPAKR